MSSVSLLDTMDPPSDSEFSWTSEEIQKNIPFTAQVAKVRGSSVEGLAIKFTHPNPPINVGSDGLGFRQPRDSWLEVIFPFGSNRLLRESLCRSDGKNLRYGLLFEKLDAFAADVAYRHAEGTSLARPLTIVTACMDGMRSLSWISALTDLTLRGYMTWVGRSSMEVRVDLLSGKNHLVGSTRFIFVARSPINHSSASVHGLITDNGLEKKRFDVANQNAAWRKKSGQLSLSVSPPMPNEVEIIHSLYLNSKTTSTNFKWARDVEHSTMLNMHMQERNIHGKIFGGFLLREAFEIAWIAAVSFNNGHQPDFIATDDLHFLMPVAIGDFVKMIARVTFTSEAIFYVSVEAYICNFALGTRVMSNKFHYRFQSKEKLPTLKLEDYQEYMRYLSSRRRHLRSIDEE